MLTKENIISIFKENKNVNFSISTTNAVGKGINGVSYDCYYGKKVVTEQYKEYTETTKILDITDTYIKLQVKVIGYGAKTNTFYIPFECINCIKFFNTDYDTHYHCIYPHKLN